MGTVRVRLRAPEGRQISHSYLHNPVHVVFSTKERRKLISNQSQTHLWAYLAGVCKKQKIFVHEIGGMEDHLHMLVQIPLTLAFSEAMQEIKTSSSRWMGRNFAWQRGFGIFGVSASNVDAVVRYIRTQEAHHRKMTFEQEFIALLDKHGVAYDPRYVFG
ncbi:MAG TPA: IS200/IS605 family transposase [Candidatus Angelobacter sp.]|nr:IS200/IS605 family transposase [Candidatus Angelobacter sp.]